VVGLLAAAAVVDAMLVLVDETQKHDGGQGPKSMQAVKVEQQSSMKGKGPAAGEQAGGPQPGQVAAMLVHGHVLCTAHTTMLTALHLQPCAPAGWPRSL